MANRNFLFIALTHASGEDVRRLYQVNKAVFEKRGLRCSCGSEKTAAECRKHHINSTPARTETYFKIVFNGPIPNKRIVFELHRRSVGLIRSMRGEILRLIIEALFNT